jgi:hypothetical protein
MAKKESYANDPAKELWRRKMVEFIKGNYRWSELKNAKVLCLPGPEMLEVFEVYDQLGIRRKNIFGAEDKKSELIKLTQLNDSLEKKINVVPMSVNDFLAQERKGLQFNIVSLDYTGYFNEDKIDILMQLGSLAWLTNNPIIITNYLEGRENNQTLKLRYLNNKINSSRKEYDCLNNRDLFSRINELSNEYKDLSLDKSKTEEEREKRLQSSLPAILREGTGFLNTRIFLESLERSKKLGLIAEKLLKNVRKKPAGWDIKRILMNLIEQEIPHSGKSIAYVEYLFWKQIRNYKLTRFEAFKYISNTGSPMISDFYAFDRINFNIKRDDIGEKVLSLGMNKSALDRKFKKLFEIFEMSYYDFLISQQNLMEYYNNYFPRERISLNTKLEKPHEKEVIKEKRNDVETKVDENGITKVIPNIVEQVAVREQIYSDISADVSDSKIMQKYTISKNQLSGYKASLKRAKDGNVPGYKAENNKTKKFKVRPEHRDAVLAYLKEGKKASEIINQFTDENGKPIYRWQAVAAFGQSTGVYGGIERVVTDSSKGIIHRNNGIKPEHLDMVYDWIISGETPESICYAFDNFYTPRQVESHIKDAIRKRDDYTCQSCGSTNEEYSQKHKHKVHVHHIDYDEKNNDPFNLISLCAKCHGLTNTVQHTNEIRPRLEAKIQEIYSKIGLAQIPIPQRKESSLPSLSSKSVDSEFADPVNS